MRVLRVLDAPPQFGDLTVRVSNLIDWAQRKQIVIPPTEPSLFDFSAVHLDSLIEAIQRGVLAGDPGHAVRAAQWMLDAGASCDDAGLRHLIQRRRDSVAARAFLRVTAAHFWLSLLREATEHGEFKQLVDPDIGLAVASARPPGDESTAGALQRQLVLKVLREEGFDPDALPEYPSGMSSPAKVQAREAARRQGMSPEAFDRTWKQLRERREIS